MKTFIDKKVLVTGAGSGIGRATAQALAKRGAYLYLCDIKQQGLDETLALIQGHGAQGSTHVCDVSDADEVKALAQTIHSDIAALDILVNNAGIGSAGRFVETSLDTWNKVVDVNLLGVVHGCHCFIPSMLTAKNGGHIVNLASAAAFVAPKDMPIYAATKFAVLGFSESLRADLHRDNIGVSAICPGIINTNIVRDTVYEGALGTGDTFKNDVIDMYQRRNYTPERVAIAILKAIEKNRAVQPVSPEAWLMHYGKRMFPGIMARLNRRDLPLGENR